MDEIEELTTAILDIAEAYGLGTPESRAIISALEHGRITIGRAPPCTLLLAD